MTGAYLVSDIQSWCVSDCYNLEMLKTQEYLMNRRVGRAGWSMADGNKQDEP